jgi:glycine amidinotransferase
MKQAGTEYPVVNSYNEWDPLEEIIVGVLEGACELPWEISLHAVTPVEDVERGRAYGMARGGQATQRVYQAPAQKELDEFVHILEAEGVTVRRPDPINHARPHATPEWTSVGGNCQANPRDVLIVFGDEIVEATMSWRSRYFEFLAYRTLLKEYFARGARWTAAPKPQLSSKLYNYDYKRGQEYVLTEFEPVFDAADMVRCGKDVFVQKSHVTNLSGIEWLRRHLGDRYNLHLVEFDDYRAIHIDATFVPLSPGKLLVNPDRPIKQMPDLFKKAGWDILTAPRSTMAESHPHYRYFRWLNMNVLNLDEKRIIVEKSEEPMIRALKDWGFEPIPCNFRSCYRYGGSFHCATVDIRRRGHLQSYF